jgi:hypothetical protein
MDTYTLVNKNLLIPQIEVNDFNIIKTKMFDLTFNKDNSYCANVYIVGTDGLYFCKNNIMYVSYRNSKTIIELSGEVPLNNNLKYITDFFETTDKHQNIKQQTTQFNKKQTTRIQNNGKELEEKKVFSDEEKELILLIEETMDIYQKEVQKKREIEKHLKILDDRKKAIEKKNTEIFLTRISKLKNDYEVYLKIVEKQNRLKDNFEIPELFLLKYKYFYELLKNENNVRILDEIIQIDLEQNLNQENNFKNGIEEIVNKYNEDSKKLNVKFNHSWDDLETEVEPLENNNSTLGKI